MTFEPPDSGDEFVRIDPSLFRDRRRQAGVGGVLAVSVLLGVFAPAGSLLQFGAQFVSASAGSLLLALLIVTAVRSVVSWFQTADYVVVRVPRRGGRR